MDYKKECSEIIEGLNEEGQQVAMTFLKVVQSNELNQKDTTQERIAEIHQENDTKQAERDEQGLHFNERMKDERTKFEALKKRTLSSKTVPVAWVNFADDVGEWLPSFIMWNPENHAEAIETIFTAGYKAAKAEQKKKADVKH